MYCMCWKKPEGFKLFLVKFHEEEELDLDNPEDDAL